MITNFCNFSFKEEFLRKLRINEVYHGHGPNLTNNDKRNPISEPSKPNAAMNVGQNDEVPPKNFTVYKAVELAEEEPPHNYTKTAHPTVQLVVGQLNCNGEKKQLSDGITETSQNSNTGLILPPLKKRKIEIISQGIRKFKLI